MTAKRLLQLLILLLFKMPAFKFKKFYLAFNTIVSKRDIFKNILLFGGVSYFIYIIILYGLKNTTYATLILVN